MIGQISQRGRRGPLRRALLAGILLIAFLSTGCQTTVGNYFANRARDLGDCLALQAGIGFGLGVEAKAAGVAHLAIGGGGLSNLVSLGWAYGRLCPTGGPRGRRAPKGYVFLGFPFLQPEAHGFSIMDCLHENGVSGSDEHHCYIVLPALTEWLAPEKEWERRERRWARTHAFDVEASVMALFVGARVGISPGEILDFLLGWVGIDIAGDDRPTQDEMLRILRDGNADLETRLEMRTYLSDALKDGDIEEERVEEVRDAIHSYFEERKEVWGRPRRGGTETNPLPQHGDP